MNRLVIVGNGFDLAHGLKTSYEDFLLDYLIKHIKNLEIYLDKGSFDDLIEVSYNNNSRLHNNGEKVIDLFDKYSLDELLKSDYVFIQNDWNEDDYGYITRESKYHYKNHYISIVIKSRFLGKLIYERKWTNIEKTYFDLLLEVFKESKDKKESNNEYKINNLNEDFDFLKAKIVEYLDSINQGLNRVNSSNYDNSPLFKIIDKCYEKPKQEYLYRFFSGEVVKWNPGIEKLFFINFNYTKLLEDYIGRTNLSQDQIDVTTYYPIHGNLSNPETIIFGYGDDTNKHYQDLEDEDNEEYLKNIKAFHYPNEPHYLDIINALEENEFDVFIIGHSLGLSDRVLLKTIFEHENCKAIKLFHRGSKGSQFSKRIALSRHFTDKIKMRSKIVDYSEEDKM